MLAVSDGRAGNARQAVALADGVAMLTGMTVATTVLATRWPWRWLAPRSLPGDARAFGEAFARVSDAPPRLAIGCGRQAALATRLLREAGARVVQVLDPRLDPGLWDLVVAPEHDALRGGNVLSLQGSLHPVDDLWLAQGRRSHPSLGQLPRPRIALLAGGASAHAQVDEATFGTLVDALEATCLREGGSLLATASRRTPDAWRARLQASRGAVPGLRWIGDRDGRATTGDPPENPYQGLLAWADRIVCTPDSVNMLSEAAATAAPLFIAWPERQRGRPRTFIEALLASGRARPLDGTLAPFPVEPLRETARIAALVQARLRR
ncbi:MAG TPA: mitochondrial fission ELM1 family protein [Xanthomonadaceae bacterium]|nr:mitochondrial fission ELM1 family protein [Xanthomonadaceae bacterium]